MSEHRWQGYTHQELYDQINQGPGPDGSSDSVRRWRELTRTLAEVDDGIAGALSAAMADWQGAAAESTHGGLRPLGNWATVATETAELMRQRAEQQAELISKARTDMPPPVSVSAEEPPALARTLIHLFGGQSDYEAQEARQSMAEQRAFEVMHTYEASTSANTTSLASFAAPPRVVVDAPAASSGGPPSITLSWSAPPPVSGTAPGPGSPGHGAANQYRVRPSAAPRPTPSGPGGSPSSGGATPRGSTQQGAPHSQVSDRARGSGHPTERADDEHREVTEQVGSPDGFFDEQRTLSRPVIGD